MSQVFAVPWNSDFDASEPAGLSPDSTLGAIDNIIYYADGGSLGGLSVWSDWSGFSPDFLPTNVGSFDFWWKKGGDVDTWGGYRLAASSPFTPNGIEFTWASEAADGNWVLLMNDSSDFMAIDDSGFYSNPQSDTWRHWKIEWEWNSPTGYTRLYLDDVLLEEWTDGRTKSRGSNPYIAIWYDSDGGSDVHLDELNIEDELIAAAIIQNTFGFPFGMRGFTR